MDQVPRQFTYQQRTLTISDTVYNYAMRATLEGGPVRYPEEAPVGVVIRLMRRLHGRHRTVGGDAVEDYRVSEPVQRARIGPSPVVLLYTYARDGLAALNVEPTALDVLSHKIFLFGSSVVMRTRAAAPQSVRVQVWVMSTMVEMAVNEAEELLSRPLLNMSATSADAPAVICCLKREKAGKEDEERKCGVCLEEFKVETELTRMPTCRHAFHHGCILRWLMRSNSCPVCRRRLDVQLSD